MAKKQFDMIEEQISPYLSPLRKELVLTFLNGSGKITATSNTEDRVGALLFWNAPMSAAELLEEVQTSSKKRKKLVCGNDVNAFQTLLSGVAIEESQKAPVQDCLNDLIQELRQTKSSQ